MMNWAEHEQEQQPTRKTVAPYWAVGAAILLGVALAGALWSGRAYSDPIFKAENEGVAITLYDEPCELAAVSNLPFKAVWIEKGKTFQGCWGARTEVGLVVAYFDDRTVGLIPIQALKKVVGV